MPAGPRRRRARPGRLWPAMQVASSREDKERLLKRLRAHSKKLRQIEGLRGQPLTPEVEAKLAQEAALKSDIESLQAEIAAIEADEANAAAAEFPRIATIRRLSS